MTRGSPSFSWAINAHHRSTVNDGRTIAGAGAFLRPSAENRIAPLSGRLSESRLSWRWPEGVQTGSHTHILLLTGEGIFLDCLKQRLGVPLLKRSSVSLRHAEPESMADVAIQCRFYCLQTDQTATVAIQLNRLLTYTSISRR